MIDQGFVRTMARYNAWQNQSLYAAAATLSDADRRADRGAFFGSIHGTLSHLLWGDSMWMSRFAPDRVSKPQAGIKESGGFIAEFADLTARRERMDADIIAWADDLPADALRGDLTWYSGAAGRELSKPRWLLIAHMFNHQTHHRGQVHAMLTAAGARPGDTDLMLMD